MKIAQVAIPSPCSVAWRSMSGDERARHCSLCDTQVHNLSSMSAGEVAALLRSATGASLCVRYALRGDEVALRPHAKATRGGVAALAMATSMGLAQVADAHPGKDTDQPSEDGSAPSEPDRGEEPKPDLGEGSGQLEPLVVDPNAVPDVFLPEIVGRLPLPPQLWVKPH